MNFLAQKFHNTLLLLSKILLFLVLFSFMISIWKNNYEEASYSNFGNYLFIVLYMFIFLLFVSIYGANKIGSNSLNEVIFSFFLCISLTNILAYIQFCLIARKMLNIFPILLLSIEQLITAVIGSFLIQKLYMTLYPPKYVLVIRGRSVRRDSIVQKLMAKKNRFIVKEVIGENHTISYIYQKIDQYDTVLLAEMDYNLRQGLINYCYKNSKNVYILPNVCDLIVRTSSINQVMDSPVFFSKGYSLSTEQAIIKRLFDIVTSLVGIIITSPIMLIICLSIKIYDGGPIIFKQKRLTKDMELFYIYKFRSMIIDAEKDGAIKATTSDPRITPIGKLIRKLRLDELPQLLNILKGEMSIVGPRPERVENEDEYESELPQFSLRYKVKAGLTGYAQIYGKYNTTPKDKLLLDLLYIENYSFFLDIKLILITLKILFISESTEGFDKALSKNISRKIKEKDSYYKRTNL